jgi:hypothetical protein
MRHRTWSLLAALTVAVGLVTVVLGVFMETVWAPATTSSTRVDASAAPFLVTSPGFLAMDGDRVAVQVQAASSDAPVFIGLARVADADAYLRDAQHRLVLGIAGSGEPITTDATGGDSPPAPRVVDIWTERITGKGSATFSWAGAPGAWALVVASDGAQPAAASVTFTWVLPPRRSSAPAVIALGVLMVVSGAVGLALLASPVRPDPARLDADAAGPAERDRTEVAR